MAGLAPVWVYLQTTPLFGLASTLLAWQAGVLVSRRLGGAALANPMLISVLLLAVLLLATGMPYGAYFAGGQYVQVLLGPATVALAVPLYDNLREVRRSAAAILPAILAGSLVAAASAMLIARALGAPRQVVLSIGPKSVTTPIAMGIAEQIGGAPSLTAVFVLLTGLTAVVLMRPVMRGLGVQTRAVQERGAQEQGAQERGAPERDAQERDAQERGAQERGGLDWRAWGLAAGTAGHGLATARVLLLSETAGAFGGLAIGLNGIVTSLILPVLARLIGG